MATRFARIAALALPAAALVAPLAALAQSPGVTTRASVAADGSEPSAASSVPAISADGRFVAFGSWADDLVPNDTQGVADVFVRDRLAETTERVSVDSTGLEANGPSGEADVSANGRWVAFTSEASNLVADDDNGLADVFVHDRLTRVTERVSVAAGGGDPDGPSLNPAISADGRFVAFESRAANLTGEPNDDTAVFLFDRDADTTTWIAPLATDPDVSADGCVVAFASAARDLVDPPLPATGREQIFVRDCATGETTLISVRADGQPPWARSRAPSISDDGRVIAYQSHATGLVPGHLKFSAVRDVFVHDRDAGTTELVSRDKHAQDCDPWQPGICFVADSNGARISGDGRVVAFSSTSPRLLPAIEPFGPQVYVYHRATGLLRRISVDPSGRGGFRCSDGVALSHDGAVIAYGSTSAEIVPSDTNGHRDILVSEWTCPPPAADAPVDPLPQECPVDFACPPTPSACADADSSTLRLRRRPIGSDAAERDELYWLWKGSVDPDALGDPRLGSGFHLCIYSPMFRLPADTIDHDAPIPGGDGWRASGAGHRFRGSGPGVDRLQLVAGPNGRILAKGRGADLALPYLPLGAEGKGPVRVRLHRADSDECWGADFSPETIRDNFAGLHRERGRDRPGHLRARFD